MLAIEPLRPIGFCVGGRALFRAAVLRQVLLPQQGIGQGQAARGHPYVVIMHHTDPAGMAKWSWSLYNIPAHVRSLPKNGHAIGTLGWLELGAFFLERPLDHGAF